MNELKRMLNRFKILLVWRACFFKSNTGNWRPRLTWENLWKNLSAANYFLRDFLVRIFALNWLIVKLGRRPVVTDCSLLDTYALEGWAGQPQGVWWQTWSSLGNYPLNILLIKMERNVAYDILLYLQTILCRCRERFPVLNFLKVGSLWSLVKSALVTLVFIFLFLSWTFIYSYGNLAGDFSLRYICLHGKWSVRDLLKSFRLFYRLLFLLDLIVYNKLD
jgi:hypothetical protein